MTTVCVDHYEGPLKSAILLERYDYIFFFYTKKKLATNKAFYWQMKMLSSGTNSIANTIQAGKHMTTFAISFLEETESTV